MTRLILHRCAMTAILKDFGVSGFAAAVVTVRSEADGAHPKAGGKRQADIGAKTQSAQPQRADGVIDFIDYLQHPLHAAFSLGERPHRRRASDHTLAMVPGAA